MGKQINFYLSNGDQDELTRQLDFKAVASMPPFPKEEIPIELVSKYARWESEQQTPVLFRCSDSSELVLRRPNPELGYFIDIFRSPAIEFSRCIITNDEILRGRLYYVAGFIENDLSKFKKPLEFIEWATDIFKIVKKLCVEKRNGDYIGKEAQSMEKLGYRFVGQ